MGMKRPLQEVDPLSLPVGTRVGPWRVKGWRGRGAYGTLYRVEREGREAAGSFALKLAIHPGDKRFEREAWLLSHIHSPFVPRLYDQGVWQHPRGAFPYLVMEWVEGQSLYDWAERRNPTSRQVLRMLAQVARALEATHEANGVHRDVKGDNVLVRLMDGRALLMDFGAGHYRGAPTLTTTLLPPGTRAYRSPEAWTFLSVFGLHTTVHYAAGACDDLFAFGVMAWRLVTDAYPPPIPPEESGSEVSHGGGLELRSLLELNPRVNPALGAIILQLLDLNPGERFHGRARELAEALEQAAESAGAEADRPLFRWGSEHRPCWRSRGGVRFAEDQDAEAREELKQQQVEEPARAAEALEQARPRVFASARSMGGAAAFLAGMLVMLVLRGLHQEQEVAQVAPERNSREDGSVAVGDSERIASAETLGPGPGNERARPVGGPLPEKPLPGQRKPPCKPNGEVEIRGGCWNRISDAQPPCEEYAFDWKGACYRPLFSAGRQPASDPP